MTDRRRDWRLYLRMRVDRITVPDWDGWTYVEEGTLAHCRRERDLRAIGPDEHWVDWSIRRPNEENKETT